MLRAKSNRTKSCALRVSLSAVFLIGCFTACFAQTEPPLGAPQTGHLPSVGDAIPIEGWLLFPSIRVYSTYSDNLFQSPQGPVAALGLGTTPTLTAEWTNGIHTTTLYGTIDRQIYPENNSLNTFDRSASVTQKYEPLRDLTFRVEGNYSHKTVAGALQNSIPSPLATPSTTVLPDGNTLLPNGTIVSPTGQPVGQTTPPLTVGQPSSINPFNQYTGTFSVDKIFNRGVLSLTSSIVSTNYETQSAKDNSSRSIGENSGVWLGPLFYAYSDGSYAVNSGTALSPGSTTSYRIVGGIGSRQFGLFRGSAYFGHQGSNGAGSAGGAVFGGKLAYYPTPPWTLNLAIDATDNVASQGFTSPLALTLPGQLPVQIPLGASTRIIGTSLASAYTISPQWSTSETVGYTRIEHIDSSALDNAWTAGATLSYDMWRNMTITWVYQYSNFLSNTPSGSSKSNVVTMSADYKF